MNLTDKKKALDTKKYIQFSSVRNQINGWTTAEVVEMFYILTVMVITQVRHLSKTQTLYMKSVHFSICTLDFNNLLGGGKNLDSKILLTT